MVATSVPEYSGDPAKCSFCIQGQYPHTHSDYNPVAKTKAPKVRKSAAPAVLNGVKRKVGRPMKPENWELIRMCECE